MPIIEEGPSPLPPVPRRLIDGACAPQVGTNSETHPPTIANDPTPESTLGQWVESNIDKHGKVKFGSLGIFPGLPDFTTRRQRLDYERELNKIWHSTEEAYASGFAIDGLVNVVSAVRAQRAQLKPPKKTTHTPRHQR